MSALGCVFKADWRPYSKILSHDWTNVSNESFLCRPDPRHAKIPPVLVCTDMFCCCSSSETSAVFAMVFHRRSARIITLIIHPASVSLISVGHSHHRFRRLYERWVTLRQAPHTCHNQLDYRILFSIKCGKILIPSWN